MNALLYGLYALAGFGALCLVLIALVGELALDYDLEDAFQPDPPACGVRMVETDAGMLFIVTAPGFCIETYDRDTARVLVQIARGAINHTY